MTSASALADTVALSFFRNIKEGMETGRIANLNTAQSEVEAAIVELNHRPLLEGPTQISDLVGKLLLEMGSLHEKVARCESQLTEFESRAAALKEETSQIVARTEACNLLVEQQQKENSKVLASMKGMKASVPTTPPLCPAPAPSPTDATLFPAPSRPAIVSFPGGPRTITIHPPCSPHYQSTIRDEKGDVIITLKATKPLRREGAFRGAIEDIDWAEIYRVHGRAQELGGSRTVPSVPRWPEPSQSLACPPPSRGPRGIIARQRQLSTSMTTDAFGRVLIPDCLANAKSPSLPSDIFSSSYSFPDLQSSSTAKQAIITPCSTPPSPSVGRGKKRARLSEEDEIVASTTETHEGAPLLIVPQTAEPKTPTPVKREESHPPEGPSKRKRLRSSASVEASPAGSLSRSQSYLDIKVPVSRTA